MTAPATTTIDQLISTALAGIQQAGKILKESCEAIVAAFDQDPDRASELLADAGVSPSTIRGMLAVGRGTLHVDLLLPQPAGLAALKSCDIAIQTKHLKDPLEVVDLDHHDQCRLIHAGELTPKQVSQVFAKGRIRTLAEQRTWLQEQQQKAPRLQKADEAYRILRGGKVEIGGRVFTKRQLLDILRELE